MKEAAAADDKTNQELEALRKQLEEAVVADAMQALETPAAAVESSVVEEVARVEIATVEVATVEVPMAAQSAAQNRTSDDTGS